MCAYDNQSYTRSRFFLCDFVEHVKFVQHKFYRLYCDPYKRFNDLTFDNFNAIETADNENIPMSWFFDLNGRKDAMYLAFSCVGHKYTIYQHDLYGA